MGYFQASSDTMLLAEEGIVGASTATGGTDDGFLRDDPDGSNPISTRHAPGSNGGTSNLSYVDSHVKTVHFPNQAAKLVDGVWTNVPQHDAATGKGSIADADCAKI